MKCIAAKLAKNNNFAHSANQNKAMIIIFIKLLIYCNMVFFMYLFFSNVAAILFCSWELI